MKARYSHGLWLLALMLVLSACFRAVPPPVPEAEPTLQPIQSLGDVPCGDVNYLMGLIATANADTDPPEGGWSFELTAGCTYTLTQPYSEGEPFPVPQDPYTGLPAITSTLTIIGNGATITRSPGAPQFRLFRVLNSGGDEAGNLTLINMTISNGYAADGNQGGALINEGGTVILNNVTVSNSTATGGGGGLYSKDGTLILNGSTVSGNKATSTDSNFQPVGGGILNEGSELGGTLTISNSTIANNEAKFSGGGVFNKEGTLTIDQGSVIHGNKAFGPAVPGEPGSDGGGGVYNEVGTLTISNSTIRDNQATADGGGVFNLKSALAISSSTISGNTANAFGGGVFTYDSEETTPAGLITNSTISGNFANVGGGVLNYKTTTFIHNSTISGNMAGAGGGVLSHEQSTLYLTYSTVTANEAGQGAGVLAWNGEESADPLTEPWPTTVKASIIAGNTGGGGDVASMEPDPIKRTRYRSLGYNVIGTPGQFVFFPIEFGATGDVRNVSNPQLGPLANNGGSTQTHAVLSGSPALDRIPNADCTNHVGSPVTRDQRGASRPQGNGCESGSFEVGEAPQPGHFILEVVVEGQGTVTRSPSASSYAPGTVVTLTAVPQGDSVFSGWSGDLQGDASPTTITMNGHKFVTATFNIPGGAPCTNGVGNVQALINAIEEANADPDDNVNTVTLGANCTYTLTDIYNIDTLNEYGSLGLPVITSPVIIEGNGSTIERRSSELGTPDFRILYVEETGELTLKNVTVSGGDISNPGGGIYNRGTLTLNSSTLSHHSSGDAGGAIYNDQGTVTLNNSTITLNDGGDYAGALKNFEGTVTITGSTISANTAADGGAGIYNEGGTLTFDNSTLADNHSADSSGMLNTSSPPSELHPEGLEGILVVRNNSVISGNTSEDMGAGLKNDGPGTRMTVENAIIENNAAGDGGGGISNDGGIAEVTNSIIRNNQAISEGGGGVYNGPGGTLTIKNSTISGNQALSEVGGGVFNSDGNATIENSTVSGNAANWGGGLANEADVEGGILTLVNSTVSGNMAGEGGGGIYNDKGGRLTLFFSTITANQSLLQDGGGVLSYNDEDVGGIPRATVKATIIAGNTARIGGFTFPNDVAAVEDKNPYYSLDYNVIGTPGANVDFVGNPELERPAEFAEDGDQTNVAPADLKLGPLANNGGPTWTHAPLSGSPAVNVVPALACTDEAGEPITKDQRGENRPQGSGCEAGSVEVIVPGATFVTISNIPSTGNVGGSFTPVYDTNSNGQTSTTSQTPNVCTVSGDVVNFVSNGTCTLRAHVAATSHWEAATGDPQSFTITNRRASAAFHPTNPESSERFSTRQYTLRITRLSGAQLGSAKISVPEGFTISNLPSPVTSSENTTFDVSYDSGTRTISVVARNNGNRLTGNGQFVDVTFTSTVASDLGDQQFTTRVWANLAFSNNEFHLTTQPVVNVTPGAAPAEPTSITEVSGSGTFGGTATLTAKLTSNGNPVSGATISFALDDDGDDDVGTAQTNAQGVATLANVNLTGYNAGTHTGEVWASFAGSSALQATSASGNLVVAKAAGSVSISNLPGSGVVGGSFTPTYTTNSDGQTSTASQTPTICSVSGGVVSYLAAGTCTLRASVTEGTNHLEATGADQSFTVAAENNRKATSAFQPGNPAGAELGTPKTFTLRVTRTATILGSARISVPEGYTNISLAATSLTSSQSGSWTASYSGGTIDLRATSTNPDQRLTANGAYVEVVFTATATGTAPRQDEWTTRAWASINFGPANEFDITVQPLVDVIEAGDKAPGSVSISNIPSSAVVGGSFTPTYNQLGNGTPSTASLTPSICSNGPTVNYLAAGTCQLQASITEGDFHEAATGDVQSFTITSSNRVATAAFRPDNPDSATIGNAKQYTLRITRVSGAQLGSARITIPTGFTVSGLPTTVTSSQNMTWNVSQANGTINLAAANTDSRLSANGAFVEVQFSATASGDPRTAEWTTRAWANLAFSNNEFDFTMQPSVNLTEAVTVNHQLTVSKTGAGTGTVSSSPAGINCGTACPSQSASFTDGTTVTLTPTPGPDSTFNGWSGAGNNGSNNTRVVEMTQARSVTATFRANQTVTFTSTPPSNPPIGSTYTPTATGGASGNPVTFSASGACSISSGVVTMTANGTCTVTANQAGNADYNPGTATQVFSVGPQTTSVINITATTSTFGGTTNLRAEVTPAGVSGSVSFHVAGSSSALAASYNASTGVATLNNYAHGLNANTSGYSVRAVFISSSANHQGSEATNPTALVVNKVSTTVSINNLPTNAQTGGNFTPTYTTTSNGQTSVVSHAQTICTVSGNVVSFVAAGTCHLQASVAEGTNHFAATGPVQSFTVAQAPPPEPVEIVFRSSTNGQNGVGTSLSLGRPSGVQAGNFLLAQVSFEKGEAVNVTAPAGWTLVNRTNSGGDIGTAIYRKVANASEPTSYMWTFSQSVKAAGGVLHYSGVNTTSPIVASSGNFGAGDTLTATSVNAEARSVAVAFFSLKKKETGLTVPSGMTSRYYFESPQDVAIRAADETRANAGATGNRTSTAMHSDKWTAQLVTLRPAQ